MSYLLTEIAMEMLGWQFYDTDGVPRPINLDALNLDVTEGGRPLEEVLEIKFLDEKVSVKAEADSSSAENGTIAEPNDFDANIDLPYKTESSTFYESDDTKSSDIRNEDSANQLDLNSITKLNESLFKNNISNSSHNLKIQSVVGGIDLGSDEAQHKFPDCHANFYTPLTNAAEEFSKISISNVNSVEEPTLKSYQTFSPNFNVIRTTKMPVAQNSTKTSDTRTSFKKSHTDKSVGFGHNYELELKVESEMLKIALDLKREKGNFLKSLDNETKKNIQEFRKSLEMFQNQELSNLQNELENLYQLRQRAEQMSAEKFPTTYPKYFKKSNSLSNDLLQSVKLKLPMQSNTNATKFKK